MKVGDLIKCREEVRKWSSTYSEYREAVGIVMGIYFLNDDSFSNKINLKVLTGALSSEAEAIVDVRLPDGTIDTFDIKHCEILSRSKDE